MKQLFFALCLLILPCSAWSAAYVASVTGNWSSSATWGGSGVPGTGDTATINNGVTVTQDGNVTVGATVVEGRLTQATGVTLTMEGALTIGNGTSKDGQFDFGAGSTLALGANNLILGNCWLRSNAISGNWAKITGTGNIQTHGTVTGPKQDIVLSYVSFQNTGTIAFAHKPGGTGAAGITNQIDIQHCTFVSTGSITSGLASTGATDMIRRWKYNDLRNVGEITFLGLTGTPTSETSFSYNTVSCTTAVGLKINNISGFTISNNSFYNFRIGVPSAGTSGGHTIERNWFSYPSSATSGSNYIQLSNGYGASTIARNYFYNEYANPHTMTVASGSGGTGTFQVTENVIEETASTEEGNFLAPGQLAINLTKNVLIGPGNIAATASSITGAGITMSQNTIFVTNNIGDNYGHTWLLEGAEVAYSGNVKISSNLLSYKSGVSPATSSYFATNNTSIIPQTLYFGDYNCYPSALSAVYRQFTVTNTGHDITNVDPGFIETTRGLETWGQTVHGTDGTVGAAVAKLLATNGYNSTSKTQSDTPSGASVYGAGTSLVDWVRLGFTPTNNTLMASGENGTYIGAIEPVAAVSGAALLLGW